jgi:hypothetical protein
MRIQKIQNILFAACLLFLASNQANSQDWVPGNAEDGTPIFNPGGLTSFDTLITNSDANILAMKPMLNDTLHLADDSWKLDGIEWQYAIDKYGANDNGYLKHSSDVDDITSFMGEPSYLITDLNDNKVIIHNPDPSSTEPIWILNPATYAGPSDADFFREGTQNRVLVSYKTSNVVAKFSFVQSVLWTYGQLGAAGSGPNQLNSPSDAVKIDSTGEYLIADTGNNRVIIVNEEKSIMWSVSGTDTLSTPVDVDYIYGGAEGDKVLITDQTMHRVFIINRNTNVIEWSWGNGSPGTSLNELNNPSDADYAEDTNHVLIADRGNNRILEISLADSSIWVWPNSVSEVEDVDAFSNDGFLVVQKAMVQSSGAITWLPTLLRFTDQPQEVVSNIFQLDKSVNFTNIFWDSDSLASGTSVAFQFRSDINFGNITKNPWLGPDSDTTSVYTMPGEELINAHKVHKFYQFKTILQTTNPRATPSVSQFGVRYASYDTTAKALVFTRALGPDSTQIVSVVWDSLVLRWNIPPEVRNNKDDMDFTLKINNAETENPVYTYQPNPFSDVDRLRLSDIPGLSGVKRIYLTLDLKTHNTAITPRLDSWQVIWRQRETETSIIEFVDSDFEKKPFYTASNYVPGETDTIFVDKVYLKISNNITELEDFIQVGISSDLTQDIEMATLSEKMADVNYYGSDSGMPIIVVDNISETVVGNDTLEVFDRDNLNVQFQSPQRPTEVSTDSILVVRGTVGDLVVENVGRQAIQKTTLGERLYFRVTSELDRSLNPVLMDSIEMTLVNNNTRDDELVTLYEIQSTGGEFNSGEFASLDDGGILLRDDPSYLPNDGTLYSRLGDVIHAVYQDNFKHEPTRVFVSIPDSITVQVAQPLLCEIAPNPYYASRDASFRLRVASSIGALTVHLIEVYNIAGEKVLEIDGENVVFPEWGGNSVGVNRYAVIESWWDLLSDSGHQISSGTYWVKLQADVLQENSNTIERLSTLAKFVVIR